jgi:hypothetical protein
VPQFNVVSQHSPGGTEENFYQDGGSSTEISTRDSPNTIKNTVHRLRRSVMLMRTTEMGLNYMILGERGSVLVRAESGQDSVERFCGHDDEPSGSI